MLTHLYLSPHFDDAVYSCGGLIHRQTRAGERVRVLTLCAGAPPAGPLSAFAETLHRRWAVTAAAVRAARQAEDAAALRLLGAEAAYLEIPDCIYRRHPESGAPLYASEEALFGPVAPAEAALVDVIAGQVAQALAGADTQVYAPLGIGRHVDHQLARLAAERRPLGRPLRYYEDYPYAARVPETPAWEGLAQALQPVPAEFAEADFEAYGRAVAAYTSQLSTFWPDEPALWAALRQFCTRLGAGRLALRLWTAAGVSDGG